MQNKPLTNDGAELEILSQFDKHGGMIAIPMGSYPNATMQLAHERLTKSIQIQLIDVTLVMNHATGKPEPARVFTITAAGRARRMELMIGAK